MLHQTQPWSRPDSIRVTGRVGKEKHVLPRGQGRAEILETELLYLLVYRPCSWQLVHRMLVELHLCGL